jgi:hypothetical protein
MVASTPPYLAQDTTSSASLPRVAMRPGSSGAGAAGGGSNSPPAGVTASALDASSARPRFINFAANSNSSPPEAYPSSSGLTMGSDKGGRFW